VIGVFAIGVADGRILARRIATGRIATGRILTLGEIGGRVAEVRKNGLRVNLGFAEGGQVVVYDFFFIKADLAGVGADKAFIENAAGELVKMFVLNGAEHARADFRGGGDGVERNATQFSLLAKFFSE
jgi:hypothetical protein